MKRAVSRGQIPTKGRGNVRGLPWDLSCVFVVGNLNLSSLQCRNSSAVIERSLRPRDMPMGPLFLILEEPSRQCRNSSLTEEPDEK